MLVCRLHRTNTGRKCQQLGNIRSASDNCPEPELAGAVDDLCSRWRMGNCTCCHRLAAPLCPPGVRQFVIRSSFPHLEAGHTGCEVIDKAVGTEMGGEVAASALPVLVALVRVGEDPVLVTILTHCSPKREEEEGKQHGCYVNLDCRWALKGA